MTKPLKRAALPGRQRTLEVFLISAQDLKHNGGKMKTYAAAYVDSKHKQYTGFDEEGGNNPTWDEKLTFSVDERLFDDPMSQLTIEIYYKGTWKAKLLGTARVFLSDAVKAAKSNARQFFQVSSILIFHDSQSQGILNICIPPNGRFPERFDHSLSIQRP